MFGKKIPLKKNGSFQLIIIINNNNNNIFMAPFSAKRFTMV